MKRYMNEIVVGTAALLILAAPGYSKDKVIKSKAPVMEAWDAKEKRREAELRAEANAPGPTREELARVRAVLAARKAREDREIARYRQYQTEQKLALAEASAPKMFIFNGGQVPGEMAPTRFSGASRSSGFQTVGVTRTAASQSIPSQGAIKIMRESREVPNYPNRFARRSAQEEGLDRQDAMLDAQARLDAEALMQSAPFGVPVPGKPGYMSSPPQNFQGFIDVRDYTPGSVVVDPYTGQKVRVP